MVDSNPTSARMATVNFNRNPPSRPPSPLKSTNTSFDQGTFRPKAKINSSATTRKVVSTASVNTSPIAPRAASPTKLTPRVRKGVLSPTQPHKAPSTVGAISRPQTPVSAPVTPELRNRSFTTSSGSLGRFDDSRIRVEGASLHHVASLSSFQPSVKSNVSTIHRLAPSKSVFGLSDRDREGASSPAMRIRSKVSSVAKSQSESITRTTTPPPQSSTRHASVHTRSPSMTSPPTSPPIHQIYPITTAVPAANPHRFVQTRPPAVRNPAPLQNNTTKSLSPPNDRTPRSGNIFAQIDPAFVPLPPHSPPTSALSFSSRSSVSHSSASHTAGSTDSRLSPVIRQAQNGSTEHLRSTLDNLVLYTSMNPGDDNYSGDSGHDRETDGEFANNEDRKVKAEAKSNRKIADLEITNRSLLAINASLESTKHRQAKEIRELRRKLRESRLILPPGTFRAVKSSLEPAENGDDEEDVDDNSEAEDVVEGSGDDTYKRVKLIVDTLLQTGRRALETQVKDFPEGGKGGAKVLSPEELRDWHGSNEHDDVSDNELQPTHGDEQRPNDLLPGTELSLDDMSISEDEPETMTLPNTSPSSPGLPPILITQSS